MRALTSVLVVSLLFGLGCQSTLEETGSGNAPISKHDFEQSLIDAALAGLIFEGHTVRTSGDLPRDPDGAVRAYVRGDELLYGHNQVLEALTQYRRAVELDPLNALGYDGVGRGLIALRKVEPAEAAFRTALAIDPDSVAVQMNFANLLELTGRSHLALEQWRRLAERHPENGVVRARLAGSYSSNGDPTAALAEAAHAAEFGHTLSSHFLELLGDRAAGRAVPSRRLAAADATLGGDPIVGPGVRVEPGSGEEPTNETSSAAVPGLGSDTIVATFNDYRNDDEVNLGISVSIDGGATWEDSLIQPPPGMEAATEGDPMTAVDPRTGTLWVGAIAFSANGGLYVARKEPGDESFQPAVFAGQEVFADKCWMAAGPQFDDPDSTAVYIAYNEGVRRSLDLGDSWELTSTVPIGQGFLPRVGPNGEVYVSYLASSFASGSHELIRSLDNGETFSDPIIIADQMQIVNDVDFPGFFRVLAYGSLAVDPRDGDLFFVYPDVTDENGGRTNVDLYFVRSSDGGSNWSSPIVLNGDGQPAGDQFFPWLEADDRGRLHLVFYDSRNVDQPDQTEDAFIDAYYAYSDDDGDSWTEIRLTDTSFNSKDAFSDTTQFLGDYLGLAVAGGNAYPTYLSAINGFSEIYVHAITRAGGGLTLSQPVPGLADSSNAFTVTGAAPGAEIYFVFGTQQGTTDVPNCTGVTVEIGRVQVMGTAIASADGTAKLNVEIPPSVAGRSAGFQAIQSSDCTTSQLVEFSFPN